MIDHPRFHVVSGPAIQDILSRSKQDVIQIVRDTYIDHQNGKTNNPDSYFLRFSDKPEARIIALPSSIRSRTEMSGIKWISSYPKNVASNLQRASAVMILNDYHSGYPIACLEASQISSARTAASAAVAAQTVFEDRDAVQSVAFIGAGYIARTTFSYLLAAGFYPGQIRVFDFDPASALNLSDFAEAEAQCDVTIEDNIEAAIRGSDIVVFATTAAEPHVFDTDLLHPSQLVLHISLRDLSPSLILAAYNFFDDIEHCMKANTSPHLTEQETGNRDFAHATIGQLLLGQAKPDLSKPVIFSPFGLGVLDLTVSDFLLSRSLQSGSAIEVAGFLPDMSRW